MQTCNTLYLVMSSSANWVCTWRKFHSKHIRYINPNTIDLTFTSIFFNQEEEMIKWSIFAIPRGLLHTHSHLPYIFNHHEHFSCFMQLYNRMTTHFYTFPVSLWPWVNIKVVQTGIKLKSLVASSHMRMINIYDKITLVEFSPLDLTSTQ